MNPLQISSIVLLLLCSLSGFGEGWESGDYQPSLPDYYDGAPDEPLVIYRDGPKLKAHEYRRIYRGDTVRLDPNPLHPDDEGAGGSWIYKGASEEWGEPSHSSADPHSTGMESRGLSGPDLVDQDELEEAPEESLCWGGEVLRLGSHLVVVNQGMEIMLEDCEQKFIKAYINR